MTDITIEKGSTFSRVLRWETTPLIYKPISGITKAGPAVVTATGHGVVDGWRVAIVSVVGMRQINAKNWPLRPTDFRRATYIDANSFSLNDVNSSGYDAYTSGGLVVYNTPVDMASFTARMQVRSTVDAATTLLSLTESAGIAINNSAKTITLTVSATATAALTFCSGVYDLEMVSQGGVVTKLLSGNVLVLPEVTR
jgi:hypothetical protein